MNARRAISVFLATALRSASRAETLNLLIWEDNIAESLMNRWRPKRRRFHPPDHFDQRRCPRTRFLPIPGPVTSDLVIVDENGAMLFGRKGIIEPLSETNLPALATMRRNGANPAPVRPSLLLGQRSASSIAPMWLRRHRHPARDMMIRHRRCRSTSHVRRHSEIFVPPLILLAPPSMPTTRANAEGRIRAPETQAPSVLTYDYVVTRSRIRPWPEIFIWRWAIAAISMCSTVKRKAGAMR